MRRASKKVRQQRVAIRAHKSLAETHSKKNAFDDAYQTIKEWLSAETLLPSDSVMVLKELRRQTWIEQQAQAQTTPAAVSAPVEERGERSDSGVPPGEEGIPTGHRCD